MTQPTASETTIRKSRWSGLPDDRADALLDELSESPLPGARYAREVVRRRLPAILATPPEPPRWRATLARITTVQERPAGRGQVVSHELDETHLPDEPCDICALASQPRPLDVRRRTLDEVEAAVKVLDEEGHVGHVRASDILAAIATLRESVR